MRNERELAKLVPSRSSPAGTRWPDPVPSAGSQVRGGAGSRARVLREGGKAAISAARSPPAGKAEGGRGRQRPAASFYTVRVV